MTTLRPFGPRVIFTALLRISTPRRMRSRASVEKRTSLAAIVIHLRKRENACEDVESVDDAKDVAFLHDKQILAVDFDLGSGPLPEEDAVAGLDVEGGELAVFIAAAGANCHDLTFLRLLLGGVGDDDARFCLRFGLDALDDDAVVQRTKCHVAPFIVLGYRRKRTDATANEKAKKRLALVSNEC